MPMLLALVAAAAAAAASNTHAAAAAANTMRFASRTNKNRRAHLSSSTAAAAAAALAACAAPTTPLHARSALAIALDPDRYGDKELKIATVNRIKQAIRNECAADLSLLPAMLRLSLADGLSYDARANTGGIDGSILLELGRPSSAGLGRAAEAVERVHASLQRQTQISKADVVAFAGAAAIEAAGGPRVVVQLGREDARSPEPEGARSDLSWEAPTLAAVRAVATQAGVAPRELVALLGAIGTLELAASSGAAQAAAATAANGGGDDDDDTLAELGIEGGAAYRQNAKAVQRTSGDFYAANKLSVDVRVVKLGGAPFDSGYFVRLLDQKKGGGSLSPLESALLADKELRPAVETFATSKQKFREELRSAYAKLQANGGSYNGAATFLDDSS